MILMTLMFRTVARTHPRGSSFVLATLTHGYVVHEEVQTCTLPGEVADELDQP